MIKQSLILFFVFQLGFIQAQQYDIAQVKLHGPDQYRIVLVFLGDGYQVVELERYEADVNQITSDLFQKSPFYEYSEFFNVYRINVDSEQSGADHPGTANDVSEPLHEIKQVETTFECTFDYGGIHRLLVPVDGMKAFLALANYKPGYDQGFIVSNSPHYGGSGGILATSSTNIAASEISIHEIGHSFANLADEYYNGSPSELANQTRVSDPQLVKWKHWIGFEGVGVYRYENSPPQSEWYRPYQNCEMRFLNREFCPVCKEQIIKSVYSHIDPIGNLSLSEGNYVINDPQFLLEADILQTRDSSISIQWIMNDSLISNLEFLILSNEVLTSDFNELRLVVEDHTDMVRDPNTSLIFERQWRFERDLDNDGYTSQYDCDDNNPDINPDAIEIPNNGIDEDCDGADASTIVFELNDLKLHLYPNPASTFLVIKSSKSTEINLKFQNVQGQLVHEHDLITQQNQLSRIELNAIKVPGIYSIIVQDVQTGQRHTAILYIN